MFYEKIDLDIKFKCGSRDMPWHVLLRTTGQLWTLEKCIDHAFSHNIQIRKSEMSNQESGLFRTGQGTTSSRRLVHRLTRISTGEKALAAGTGGFTGSNGSNYSVNSGVTIYNASRLNNQIKQADLELQGDRYSLETTKESISLSILNAYLQVLYAEEQVKNSKKQIESTTGQLNLAGERLALQSISVSDYAQVKSQLASEKLTLANSESQLSIAKITLMQLMELPVQDNFNVSHPDLTAELNQSRIPDVRAVYATAIVTKTTDKKCRY